MRRPFRPRPVPLAGALYALLAASLVAAPAAAQPAPSAAGPASYDLRTYRFGFEAAPDVNEVVVRTTPGTVATANGRATVGVQTAPFTLLTARATTDAVGILTGAQARMRYSFRILGAAGTRVGATLTADLFRSVAGLPEDERTVPNASVELSAADPTGTLYDPDGTAIGRLRRSLRGGAVVPLPGGPGFTQRATPTVGFTVEANALYEVLLEVIAQTATPGVAAEASLDPVLTIDPAYQGAYRLVLSPGVSNLGPTALVTPEPSTWALVGAGLAGVAGSAGVARRRRSA